MVRIVYISKYIHQIEDATQDNSVVPHTLASRISRSVEVMY